MYMYMHDTGDRLARLSLRLVVPEAINDRQLCSSWRFIIMIPFPFLSPARHGLWLMGGERIEDVAGCYF